MVEMGRLTLGRIGGVIFFASSSSQSIPLNHGIFLISERPAIPPLQHSRASLSFSTNLSSEHEERCEMRKQRCAHPSQNVYTHRAAPSLRITEEVRSVSLLDVGHQILTASSIVWPDSEHHLIQRNAEGPPIRSERIALTGYYFGRYVSH